MQRPLWTAGVDQISSDYNRYTARARAFMQGHSTAQRLVSHSSVSWGHAALDSACEGWYSQSKCTAPFLAAQPALALLILCSLAGLSPLRGAAHECCLNGLQHLAWKALGSLGCLDALQKLPAG